MMMNSVVVDDTADELGREPTLAGPDLWCTLTEEHRLGIRALSTPGTPPGRREGRHVVIVPGLGALDYLLRFVRELAGRGHRVTLLDLPGFGRRDVAGRAPSIDCCAPSIAAVAEAAAAWCVTLDDDEPPVLLGHSTGAQSALLAAVRLQAERPPAAVVLASPTVAPNQRSLPRLLAAAPVTHPRDLRAELSVLGDVRRNGRDALRLLRSAIADRPERTVRGLTVPLLVTAGRRDAFVPPGWLVVLAHGAPSRSARVVRLPGSHNNPFTHPAALATVVEGVVSDAGRVGRARRTRRPARASVPRSA
jgi:pimeloyl-ACP methyl ester carboxylesterase